MDEPWSIWMRLPTAKFGICRVWCLCRREMDDNQGGARGLVPVPCQCVSGSLIPPMTVALDHLVAIAVLGKHEVNELGTQREHRQAVAAAEADDAAGAVDLQDAEARGLVARDGNDGDGGVGLVVVVGGLHLPEVALVELVAGEDEDVAALVAAQVPHALAHGVGGALEPVGALLGLLGGQDGDEAAREDVELVGLLDVLVEALGVVLGEHEDPVEPRVQAVADGDVDEPVLGPDGDGRLGADGGEGKEASAAPAAEDHRDAVFHAPEDRLRR